MTLLEDARRLAEKNPHDAGWACFSCGMPGGRNSGFGDMHHTDCSWLALPKIVAALEAAELVTIAAEEERTLFGVRAGSQLVAALEKLDEVLDS